MQISGVSVAFGMQILEVSPLVGIHFQIVAGFGLHFEKDHGFAAAASIIQGAGGVAGTGMRFRKYRGFRSILPLKT